MNVLGLSAFYHESACCLLRDGRLVAAAAEERFSRVKHDARLPVRAFRFCLERGGLDLADLDAVAYYEEPVPKLARQLWSSLGSQDRPPDDLAWLDPQRPEREIREGLGWDGPLWSFPHHLSHAASSFDVSGYPDAAVLVADGVGEWATTSYGRASQMDGAELFHQVDFPHSLGLFYSAVTAYLGFRVLGGEAKVMGLAAYGEPRFADRLRRVLRWDGAGDGDFRLDLDYFDFVGGGRMYSDALADLLGAPPRPFGAPPDELTGADATYRDVAASAQAVLEEVLLDKARWLHTQAPSRHLCLAGGVALNGVANGRLVREGPFEHVFAPPAPGDQGACLGAAALAHRRLLGARDPDEPAPETTSLALSHPFWGSGWSAGEIDGVLTAAGIEAESFARREADLLALAARRLSEGAVVGWFVGRSELGPRALGARCILADPRDERMRGRVNRVIKRREGFRPFAPAVLAEHAADHFEIPAGGDDLARFMLLVCPVASSRQLPAVTHADGSARPQVVDRRHAPRFAALLDSFYRRTGCPVLLSTSFNVRGQPLVDSPADALVTMVDAGLDALVLEDRWIERDALPSALPAMLASLAARPGTALARASLADRDRASSALYTFV
jgi:carbamoyltransferase